MRANRYYFNNETKKQYYCCESITGGYVVREHNDDDKVYFHMKIFIPSDEKHNYTEFVPVPKIDLGKAVKDRIKKFISTMEVHGLHDVFEGDGGQTSDFESMEYEHHYLDELLSTNFGPDEKYKTYKDWEKDLNFDFWHDDDMFNEELYKSVLYQGYRFKELIHDVLEVEKKAREQNG